MDDTATNKEIWRLALIDEVYSYKSPNRLHDVFAHVNLVQKDEDNEENDYYEALIPELNFMSIFILKSRIQKFL
jgi:hypothetical protein